MNEPRQLDVNGISIQSILATIYLAIFGSLLALTAYSWLLKNVSVASVSTYTFINPVIAVVLGWLILNENITWQTAVAVLLIVLAVVLIVVKKQPGRQKVDPELASLDASLDQRSGKPEEWVETGT
jgi:drug/metabolite transporter (DMT)-like permease